jgi:hypothetical protein
LAFIGAILVAAVGAGIGAVLAVKLPRAKPLLLIDSIAITSGFPSDNELIIPNSELIRRIDDYPNVLVEDADGNAAEISNPTSERQYVETLTVVGATLENEAEFLWPHVLDVAKRLRDFIVSERFGDFEDLYSREQETLWGVLEGEVARGGSPFASEPTSAEDLTAFHEVTRDDSGDVYVVLDGPRSIVFAWSLRIGPRRLASQKLSERSALAVAFRLHKDLLEMVDFLERSAAKLTVEAKELRRQIVAELAPHDRIAVSGVLANTGDKVFSVVNIAKLVIDLSGYQVSAPPDKADDSPDGRSVIDPIELTCDLGSADGDGFAAPLVVNPGSSMRFVVVVPRPLAEQRYGAEILSAYRGAERSAYLIVGVLLPQSNDVRALYSRSVLFRDISGRPSLPSRPRRRLTKWFRG